MMTLENNNNYKIIEDKEIKTSDCEKGEYYFSNNDGGEKDIALLIKDKENITIDFSNHTMKYLGRISPIIIDNSKNITIKNLEIDYDRTFYSQGDIMEVTTNSVTIKMDEGFDYKIDEDGLTFLSNTWENDTTDCYILMQEFDIKTRSLAIDSKLRIGRINKKASLDPLCPMPIILFSVEDLGDRTFRLSCMEDISHYRVGYKMIMTHEKRSNSGISITNSQDITLENINIVHTGAMGIIAQLTKNINLINVKVDLFEGKSKGLVSTNCDATHFVNCLGDINIDNCVFNNMMDDGVNVHGVYTKVEKIDGDKIFLKLMHFQHFNINFYRQGDIIKINSGISVDEKGRYRVLKSDLIEKDLIEITLDKVDNIEIGDFADSVTCHPNVQITNTTTGFNRPRGFLLTTRGKVVIKNNTFNNCCFGIHIAGDTTFWYESTQDEDVLIENNRFNNNGVQFGDFNIAITPEYKVTENAKYFHKNIKIENNVFYSFVNGAVFANGVDGLSIKNNKFIQSFDYDRATVVDKIVFEHCNNVIIENNENF